MATSRREEYGSVGLFSECFCHIFHSALPARVSKTTLLFSFKELCYPSSLNVNIEAALWLTGVDWPSVLWHLSREMIAPEIWCRVRPGCWCPASASYHVGVHAPNLSTMFTGVLHRFLKLRMVRLNPLCFTPKFMDELSILENKTTIIPGIWEPWMTCAFPFPSFFQSIKP